MRQKIMQCLLCGLETEGQTNCPNDGIRLVEILEGRVVTEPSNAANLEGTLISNCQIVEKLSTEEKTITYSAKHLLSGNGDLKVLVRPTTSAAGAAEFIRYARHRARKEGLEASTSDLGVSEDGSFMFVVFDPSATDEIKNPTIEQSLFLAETVKDLMRKHGVDVDAFAIESDGETAAPGE